MLIKSYVISGVLILINWKSVLDKKFKEEK